jgi:hypothetical protein
MVKTQDIVKEIILLVDARLSHNDSVLQIEHIFRGHGFYTTREYPIYKIKDGSGRSGRIDIVARKGKFRIAIEYDHHKLIKWKSFQKIVQIKPEAAIAISGNGGLNENMIRAEKYAKHIKSPLYVVSLNERKFIGLEPEEDG